MANSSAYVAAFRERRRVEAIELLGGKCTECGATEALEIDHIDRATKRYKLDKAGSQIRRDLWRAELEKCQLLCGPHHASKTARENSAAMLRPIQHGTEYAYIGRGCRCELCRATRSARRKERRQQKATQPPC